MPENQHPPVKIFISYSHKDNDLCEELLTQMAPLKWRKMIEPWHDRLIDGGGEWDTEIKKELAEADIILLLVSSPFLASRYIHTVELEEAMKRHKAKEAVVIPIILRPCDWTDSEFRILKALPKDGKPVVKWDSTDEGFLDVVKGIKRIIPKIQERKAQAAQNPTNPTTTTTTPSTEPDNNTTTTTSANQQQIDGLKAAAAMHQAKLNYLMMQSAMSAGGAAKFQLEQEIKQEQLAIKNIQDQIDKL